jgi:hypothetical protein
VRAIWASMRARGADAVVEAAAEAEVGVVGAIGDELIGPREAVRVAAARGEQQHHGSPLRDGGAGDGEVGEGGAGAELHGRVVAQHLLDEWDHELGVGA